MLISDCQAYGIMFFVERDRPFIDHYIRTVEGWRGEVPIETLDAVLRLSAIEFEMPVAEIYRDVMTAPAA